MRYLILIENEKWVCKKNVILPASDISTNDLRLVSLAWVSLHPLTTSFITAVIEDDYYSSVRQRIYFRCGKSSLFLNTTRSPASSGYRHLQTKERNGSWLWCNQRFECWWWRRSSNYWQWSSFFQLLIQYHLPDMDAYSDIREFVLEFQTAE